MAVKKNGPAVIDQMVGKFQGIVDGLDKGVKLCTTQQKQNSKVINNLISENTFLEGKTTEAKIFRDNLKDMLTKKPSGNKEGNA